MRRDMLQEKGKTFLIQTWRDPEIFSGLRSPDYKTIGIWRL